MFRKFISLLIVISFLLIGTAIALAVDVEKTIKTVPMAFVCPVGWEKAPNQQYTCVPKKPAPLNCPAGYQYIDNIKCSLQLISGTLTQGCQGCSIGCAKIQIVK